MPAAILTLVPKAPTTRPTPVNDPNAIAADLVVLAERIRRGELPADRVLLHVVSPDQHTYYTWGVSAIEHVGLLEVAKGCGIATEVRS